MLKQLENKIISYFICLCLCAIMVQLTDYISNGFSWLTYIIGLIILIIIYIVGVTAARDSKWIEYQRLKKLNIRYTEFLNCITEDDLSDHNPNHMDYRIVYNWLNGKILTNQQKINSLNLKI